MALGSWEQHGPHLPLDTDTIIIDTVVATALMMLNEASNEFVVAPTLTITASDEHVGFPGTLSTGTDALVQCVVAICRSASWARGVCIVNGHGGNFDALQAINSALIYEGIIHSIWSLPAFDGADMHAGDTETSLMMHIAPHAVAIDRRDVGNTSDATSLIPAMRDGGVRAVSDSGILGDARTATAEHGAQILSFYATHLGNKLLQCCRDWAPSKP